MQTAKRRATENEDLIIIKILDKQLLPGILKIVSLKQCLKHFSDERNHACTKIT